MQFRIDKLKIPPELIEKALWCCWSYEKRRGKLTKAPKNPKTGGNAQSNNPSTFADFPTAFTAYESGNYTGLGVGIFTPYAAVDIDHCISEDGVLSDKASDIIDTMQSYTEISPSGSGIRIFFRIASSFVYDKARYYIMNSKAGLEIYVSGHTRKFCTITGNRIFDYDLRDATEALPLVLEKYMRRDVGNDEPTPALPIPDSSALYNTSVKTVIDRASRSKNADKFKRLFSGDYSGYGSHSEADAALCEILAFYAIGDTGLIDAAFRESGLMREEKWDRKQSGSTYGAITIENGVNACAKHGGFYNPNYKSTPTDGQDDPLSEIETEHTQQERISYVVQKTLHLEPELIKRLSELNPSAYNMSDRGSSELFADCFRQCLRYDTTAREWRHYNGSVWELDMGGMIAHQRAKQFYDALMHYACSIEDEGQQTTFRKWYGGFGSKSKRDTLLKDAADCMYLSAEKLDADSNLLNLQNGTLELNTLTFREHRADDFLTRCTGASYDLSAQSELWERFITQVIPNDQDKQVFFQMAVGHALLGMPLERFYILYGRTTRNGKSTALEAIAHTLGDYARRCEPETLAMRKQRDSRAPSEDLARLAGCRFLTISEPPQNMVFDVALLKKLTGGDTITARFLNQGSFEYTPQFTLFMNTNYLPRVLDETLFSSGRVHVIEFQRHFKPEEQDKSLKRRLQSPENMAGILNWMLDGLRMYREHGMDDLPCTVADETDAYRMQSDKFSNFAEECLEPQQGAAVTAKELYTAYQFWCRQSGFAFENKSKFFDKLRARGLLSDTGTVDGRTVHNVVIGFVLTIETA